MKFAKRLMQIGALSLIAAVTYDVYIHDGITSAIIAFALSSLSVGVSILFIEMFNEDEED